MSITVHCLLDVGRCDEVFALYRSQSGTLGFMPRGAFEESIAKQRVLVAADQTGALVGYVMYRVTDRTAIIAHLCVKVAVRQSGIATKLLTELKRITAHLDGIKLKCRRDFDAHRLWPKVGFVAKGSAIGRGEDSAELVIWHLDHNPTDLLSAISSTKTVVAIDANVFFDLFWPGRAKAEISGALTEPWLDDIVELAVTPEIYNDIDRCADHVMRHASKAKVPSFRELRCAAIEVDKKDSELKQLYAPAGPRNERDRSDIRHLAYTIVAGVRYFVTRDEGILARGPEILSKYDVHVLTPVELVLNLDAIEREQEYQPIRLGASSVSVNRLPPPMIEDAVNAFRAHPREKLGEFRHLLETCLSDTQGCSLQAATDALGRMAALLASKQETPSTVSIKLLRIGALGLSPTVGRHLLMKLVSDSARSGVVCIRVSDPGLSPQVMSALNELGFTHTKEGWIKPLMHGFWGIDLAMAHLNGLGINAGNDAAMTDMDQLGTIMWPGKLRADQIKCYLVPIQAQWAEHFFDTELASQRLPVVSGIKEELHLGVEGVYYSASKMSIETPAHILWYVSEGVEGLGSMEVKATSRLREVVRGPAKSLFGRFRRLGVYEWRDLMATAKNNKEAELMALRFSHTELFPQPVGVATLRSLGIPDPYMGPRLVPHDTFERIYHQAFQTKP